MISMMSSARKCQGVPDRATGIVIGADISKGKIDFGAFRPDKESKVYTVKQDQEGFGVFMMFVRDLRGSGYEPWIAFEPTGPYGTSFREMLLGSGERVVQVNGYHVKRTKEVRDNSPRKTDEKDPRVIADLVWQGCYQELVGLSGDYAQLRGMSAEWASLAKKRTAASNEFQSHLEVWFPELKGLFKDSLCHSVRGLVRKYASPQHLGASRISSVRAVLKKSSKGRTTGRADEIRSAAQCSIAPCSGQEARRAAMLNLLDIVDLLERCQARLRAEMEGTLRGLPEAVSMLSVFGIGIITAAGIIGECGDIGLFRSYGQLEKFMGMNLYEVSSGKQKGSRHISKRGRARARCLLCNAAVVQIRHGGLFYEYAKELKAKGKKTGQIRVAIARKLLALLYAVARDRSEFADARFNMGARTEDGQAIQQGTQSKAAA
jgi:transposase